MIQEQLIEESKSLNDEENLRKLLSKIPKNNRFMRFSEIPKELVTQFHIKGFGFWIEEDKRFMNQKYGRLKNNGKPTFKFAVENPDRDLEFSERLTKKGYKKVGPLYVPK